MSTTAVQSSAVPFYLSGDGITYKMLVCKTALTFNLTKQINIEQTDCGGIAGVSSPEWNFDIDAVANMTPDAGSAVSYEDILSWTNTDPAVVLYCRWNHPDSAGTNFKHQGQCYLTNLRAGVQQGNAMNFTVTVTGTGVLTIA